MQIHVPSDAAQTRRQLARELVNGMQLQPDQEVVLTGSVARGISDRFSDIEIRFLVDTLEPADVYDAHLRATGALVEPATSLWNGMITSKSWFKGVFIEAAWQTWDGLEQSLVPVLAAETTEHWAQVEAWHVFHALPFTDAPRTKQWQQRLAHYPDALQTKLINNALATWVQPHWYPLSPVNAWPVAQRNARMALTTKLIQEIERALRLVFAVNTQWEPDYKWLWFEQQRLQHTPDRLAERVNEVFETPDAAHSIRLCFDLILDILALVPAPHDVSVQVQRITEALQPNNLLRHRS